MRELRTAAIAIVAISLAFGLAYPLAMTGAGQTVFGGAADGSLVKRDGKVVGSRLIGQDFSRDTGRKDKDGNAILAPDLRYFQSRPSATGYSPSATFFNNLGPNQQDLADLLEANLKTYLDRERAATPGLRAGQVPSDAVTTSASGVDPDISEANARIQANRVAQRRGLSRARVLKLIDDHTSHPLLGLAGKGSVNVLELNLALDRESTR
jgi:potassium-transporting ATPase KdpC subunit